MEHVDWSGDVRDVNHVPHRGERIFIDTPDSLRMPLTRMSVVLISRQMGEAPNLQEERVKEIADNNYKPGTPYVVTV
jgi:hypothetical protein